MGVMRVQHIFLPKSGLVEDQVVNTFHVRKVIPAPVSVGDASQVIDQIQRFYQQSIGAGPTPWVTFASSTFASPHTAFKVYDMDDALPRTPLFSATVANINAVTATAPLPQEVSICLSLKCNPVSGVSAGRLRGRLYLGPIQNSTGNIVQNGTNGMAQVPLVTASAANSMTAAAARLQTELNGVGYEWVVYSPSRRGVGTADAACARITSVWVDDAFDTQRRRGPAPTARLTVLTP